MCVVIIDPSASNILATQNSGRLSTDASNVSATIPLNPMTFPMLPYLLKSTPMKVHTMIIVSNGNAAPPWDRIDQNVM